MIQVNGRTLVIPLSERQIGTIYDANADVRQFSVRRNAYGVDLSHLTYHLDMEYPGGKRNPDTCLLEKMVTDEEIILTWQIPKAAVAEEGTIWASIRAMDGNNTIRWGSNKGAFYVEENINAPGALPEGLTELEQLEVLVEKSIKMSEAVKETAQQAVERADQATEKAQDTISQAEEVLKAAGEKVTEAGNKVKEAEQKAKLSEAWAHGREEYPESAMDNSYYWSEVSKTEAQKAKTAAGQAVQLAGIMIPEFYLDIENAELYVKNAVGVDFLVEDATLYWKLTGSVAGGRR